MPLSPEEPQIPESAQGPSTTPAPSRSVPTPRPVPGPRPAAAARPGRPGPRPVPPAQRKTPRPGPQAAPSASAAPQIQLIPAPVDGALDAAEEAVDLLLDSGRAPGEVLVITTGDPHPWAVHELSFGEDAYWAQHDAGDDVFYADASALDRLTPRPVTVIAVNGGSDDAVAAALPTALRRAGALLVVCGEPQRVNAVLGAGV
ncbi:MULTISPECIES: hypothetical protein [Streptomyces]|uniref:Uncharacterized protein n=1 Tax=Streptomyces chilikensis TaxID=1194079 RepID=A0ABV3EV70_9ACTN|nr:MULTISPECIES: hypothetical protein [Streptomyces]MDH6224579.1 hypothetical protein [Streptomyces sp. MJP52]